MGHNHSIIDTDKHFIIDTESRAVTNENADKIIIMQGDHNAERFTFEMSERFIEEHDMSLCDSVRVHYLNVSANNKDVSTGIYEVKDVVVSDDEDGKITFSWLISGNATKYAGALTFLIEFQCHEGTEIVYEWNTARHIGINIGEGMDNAEEVITRNVDILTEWNARLYMQATANEQSIAEVREEVGDVNARLTEMDEKYDNIVPLGDYIGEDGELILTKTTTEKTLKNSHAGGVKITPYGNTEQYGTTGAQLFDASKLPTKSVGGATVTNNGDGSFTISGSVALTTLFNLQYEYSHEETVKLLKSGTLYCDFNAVTTPYMEIQIQADGATVKTMTNKASATNKFEITQDILDNESAFMRIMFYGAVNTITPCTIKPMLYQDGDGTWEPYTGGQASPNPDYPQEIKSVKGKNLLKNTATSKTINGVTFTVNDDGSITCNGTATANAVLYLFGSWTATEVVIPSGEYIANCHGNKNVSFNGVCNSSIVFSLFGSASDKTVTLTGGLTAVYVQVSKDVTVSNETIYPMLRKATISDDTYVPYGCLRFKAHGKNLFNVDAPDKTDMVLSTDGTFVAASGFMCYKFPILSDLVVSYNAESGFDTFRYGIEKDGVVTRTANQNGKFVVTKTSGDYLWISIVPMVLSNVQVEYGTEATAYEPYTENSITLSEPIELNGINDVRDGIVEKDGVYGVERKLGVKEFTSVTAVTNNTTPDAKYIVHFGSIADMAVGSWQTGLSNMSINKGVKEDNSIRFGSSDSAVYLYLNNEEFATVKSANTFLASNPMVVCYPLAEPTFEPLPTADQIALRSLMSYDGVTYVSCDSEVEPLIVTKYGTSEVGALSLHNSNLHGINEVLRAESTNKEEEQLAQIEQNKNDISQLSGEIEELENTYVIVIGKNLYDKSKTIKGCYLDENGNSVANDRFNLTDYIPVTNRYIISSCFINGARSIVPSYFLTEYDSEKNKINYVASKSRITLNENTRYIRFSVDTVHDNEYMTEYGEETTEYEPYTKKYILKPQSLPVVDQRKWLGLKWTCIGDSLTENNDKTTKHYFDYISEKTGISVQNLGVSGSGYARKQDTNQAFFQQILLTDLDTDVVTIFGSFNDSSADLPYGNINDNGTDTYYGCVNKAIDNIYSILPTVQLGIIAPTPWETVNAFTIEDVQNNYVTMLENVCKKRGIPFLNLYYNSGLRPWDENFKQLAYSKDNGYGCHPDEVGHKIIAPRIEKFLDELLLH